MSARAFDRLLPALRHLARFPSSNHGMICARHGLQLTEVQSFIRTRVSELSAWDDEALEDTAKELGVTLRPWKPGALPPPKAPHVSPPLSVTKESPPASEVKVDSEPAPKPVKGPQPDRRVSRRAAWGSWEASYLAVMNHLLADALLSENAACEKAGLKAGTWSYFKTTRFGGGPIDRDRLYVTAVALAEKLKANVPDRPKSAAPEKPAAPRPMERPTPPVLKPRPELKSTTEAATAVGRRVMSPSIPRGNAPLVTVGGELFRLEVIVRLTPAGGGR